MAEFKTFNDLEYKRPDFDKAFKDTEKYIEDLKAAKSYEELRNVILTREEDTKEFHAMFDIAYIRNGIDTTDEFYAAEMNNFYANMGKLSVLGLEADKALLASPFIGDFEKEFGAKVVKEIEMGLKLSSETVVDDMAKDNQLCQEYNKILSACTAEFKGETRNINAMLKFMTSPDREERKAAFKVWSDMYESISGELDRIYDEMIALRKVIAEKLGFDSYIDFIYARMGRMDYKPCDVANFRKQVLEHITPVCQRLFDEQAKRIGVEDLQWYDEQFTDPDGNATPIGTKDEMLLWAKEMYNELSPETGEFWNFMYEHEMYDLEGKLGKQPGGYCAFVGTVKSPFIFANFNGTSGDVDVLTHEAGHAFEAYTASRIYPLSSMMWSSSEINEIHSMAMEFFTYPWMEKFFGDNADKYRARHLAYNLSAVTYMICVDEFQHRVFEENLDAAGRRKCWRELENTYMPWRSYEGSDFLMGGGFWMQKMHIFINPFYYVDYALAQMGAFGFYKRMDEDFDKAWADYLKLCQSGGSRGYFETLAYADIDNPFVDGTVKSVADFLVTKLF